MQYAVYKCSTVYRETEALHDPPPPPQPQTSIGVIPRLFTVRPISRCMYICMYVGREAFLPIWLVQVVVEKQEVEINVVCLWMDGLPIGWLTDLLAIPCTHVISPHSRPMGRHQKPPDNQRTPPYCYGKYHLPSYTQIKFDKPVSFLSWQIHGCTLYVQNHTDSNHHSHAKAPSKINAFRMYMLVYCKVMYHRLFISSY